MHILHKLQNNRYMKVPAVSFPAHQMLINESVKCCESKADVIVQMHTIIQISW